MILREDLISKLLDIQEICVREVGHPLAEEILAVIKR